MFKKLKFNVVEVGGDILVYDNIKGDYRQSKGVMDKIYNSLLDKDKVETFQGFGIYYDNPQKVAKEELKSEAGCVLPQKYAGRVEELSKKYKIKIPDKEIMITTEFPFKGGLSVIFSIMKVYPALKKYAESKSYNPDTYVMEIYDVPNKKIMYRMKIDWPC